MLTMDIFSVRQISHIDSLCRRIIEVVGCFPQYTRSLPRISVVRLTSKTPPLQKKNIIF